MSKIPSRKFSTAKRKIASTKFSTVKRKLRSGQFADQTTKIASTKFSTVKRKLRSGQSADQTAKIPSRQFAKAKKATGKVVDEPAPLGHPADEQDRQEVVATLKLRTLALKKRAKTKTAR